MAPSSRLLCDLDPALQPLCLEHLARCNSDASFVVAGARVFVTQTYRNAVDQNTDYAQGRVNPGHIITNARYGQSPHNTTLPDGTPSAQAYDIAIELKDGSLDWPRGALDALWLRAIAIGKDVGLVDGHDFHSLEDNPHFELPGYKPGPATLAA